MLDLQPIAARLAAVPAPPWGEFCESGDWWIQQVDSEGSPIGDSICNSGPDDLTEPVTQFVLHAPSDIAALLSEVRRLRCEDLRVYTFRENLALKVVRAAVDLVCSTGWQAGSDEERALEQLLQRVGWVMPAPADRDETTTTTTTTTAPIVVEE